MTPSRRDFLRQSTAFGVAFSGLNAVLAAPALRSPRPISGYGPLVNDPAGLLSLPKGFAYKIISRRGDRMDDGLVVPDLPDGMATFAGPDGRCLLLRNHELSPKEQGAWQHDEGIPAGVDTSKFYDLGAGDTPSTGGVTTIVYNTREQRVERQFLRLGGTIRNCSGGPTPWGSWITCEETNDAPGHNASEGYYCDQYHGYAFEVPASAKPELIAAEPLRAMGRFRREAVAVNSRNGIVYQTEDMDDSCFYRFVPNTPGKLNEGGKLQALAITGRPSLDTRNWPATKDGAGTTVTPGEIMAVEWIDLDDVEAPNDDLRHRAFNAGATRFARGEGIWYSDGVVGRGSETYFACTSGGTKQIGQLFRLVPGENGQADTLELFIEPNDSSLVQNADNLTAAAWGDLIVCEDRQGPEVRLIGITPDGGLYTLAHSHARCEFAGVCFSPDASTLFVNVQTEGLTLAITGPWRS